MKEFKYCKRCDQTLPVDRFTKSKSRYDGLQSYCQVCMKLYRIEHYRANKKQYYDRNQKSIARAKQHVLDIKNSTPCTDCGEVFPGEPWLTEFDHLSGMTKKSNVSTIVNDYGLTKRLLDEIAKCELVCLKCHRRRTARRGGWLDNRMEHVL